MVLDWRDRGSTEGENSANTLADSGVVREEADEGVLGEPLKLTGEVDS